MPGWCGTPEGGLYTDERADEGTGGGDFSPFPLTFQKVLKSIFQNRGTWPEALHGRGTPVIR